MGRTIMVVLIVCGVVGISVSYSGRTAMSYSLIRDTTKIEPVSEANSRRLFLPTAQNDSYVYPYSLGAGRCDPNPAGTTFQGFVRDANNNRVNDVCVHLRFYEPRYTICSGCDQVAQGSWGFSPFGGPAPAGVPVEIFVVPCAHPMPVGGHNQQSGFGDLTPLSPKWTRIMSQSEQCTGITFYKRDVPATQLPINAGRCAQCKFKIYDGPKTLGNDGQVLRIQADFIHSGVDGGQRQGEYSIGVEKDGYFIGHFASVQSVRLTHETGPQGNYNYEASIERSSLPGRTVQGRYYFWVLNGNGWRDSEVWTLDLEGNEGDVWIGFDQG